MEGLFPSFLDIKSLLDILSAIDVADTGGGVGFEWLSAKLVDRLDSRNDLEQLLFFLDSATTLEVIALR